MKVRKFTWIVSVFLVLLLLAGCGGAAKNEAMSAPGAPMMQAAGSADYAMAETMAAADVLTEESGSETSAPDSRKWIITVDMNAETEDLDAMLTAVNQQIEALGGYVENQGISNGSRYASYRYRNANLTVRIPAERVDEFTDKVSGFSNVVRSSKNLEDITLRYVDTESRMIALQTEEARLLELMAKADTMSDLLEIEARLTDVRYELDSVTSRLRTYDNQVNFATVYLYIEEVKEYTPVAEKTVWQRISDGFVKSLKGIGEGAVDVGVWFVVNIPYILVYGAILFGAVKLIVFLKKKRSARKSRNAKEGTE